MHEYRNMSCQNSMTVEHVFVMDYLNRNGYRNVAKELEKETKRQWLQNLKDPDEVTPVLVYDYLVKHGYQKVAKKLAFAIIDKDSSQHCEEMSERTDPDSITFTLVNDYLNKCGYRIVSRELQNEVKCSIVDFKRFGSTGFAYDSEIVKPYEST